jgi:hypothetical protein
MKKFITILLALVLTIPAIADVTFNGDARYRYQMTDMTNDTVGTDHAQKLRLRLGIDAIVNDHISMSARLTTGPENPTSTNTYFGDNADKKDFWVDRMFLKYEPFEQVTILGGKFGVPGTYTDLVFDPDVNLDGTNVCYKSKYVDIGAGGFWIDHVTPDSTSAVFMYELGFNIPYFEPTVGYHWFTHVGYPLRVVDINVSVPIRGVEIYGNYIMNTEADSSEAGYLVGFTTKFKFVNADYNYRMREANAAYTPFVDNDFAGGALVVEGHTIKAWVIPYPNTNVGATYMMAKIDPDGGNTTDNRLLADFCVNF